MKFIASVKRLLFHFISNVLMFRKVTNGGGCIYPPAYFHGSGISFGKNVNIGRSCRIETFATSEYPNPVIDIQDNVNINWYCHIGAINKIQIGKNVLIGSFVMIIDHSHGDNLDLNCNPQSRPLVSDGPIIIEENCWIGEKCSILPNVRIGRNSVIGANSVVTKDIPPYSIAVGCPAKVIKTIGNEC